MTSYRNVPVQINGSLLMAVPAVHFRVPFAEWVNRLCANPDTRPDAIAVELEPETAAAAAAWMKEIGIGSNNDVRMPCMLCLTKIKRHDRQSEQQANALKMNTADDLDSVLAGDAEPDERSSVLPLSPVDSIIEAIRCSLELNIPLYGVDSEDIPSYDHQQILIQDPLLARKNLGHYITRNAAYAEQCRDAVIDHLRETVMVAQLKTILKRHKRVLFTGGLGHWLRIKELLIDATLCPIPAEQVGGLHPANYIRAIMHPVMAMHYMDAFPAIVDRYEKARKKKTRSPRPAIIKINSAAVLKDVLTKTYKRYFEYAADDILLEVKTDDISARGDFEQLIHNLCIVKQRTIPDLMMVVRAARGIMSREFYNVLVDKLLCFPWASQSDFPDLPVLLPAGAFQEQTMPVKYIDSRGRQSKTFSLKSRPGTQSESNSPDATWVWENEPGRNNSSIPAQAGKQLTNRRTWPPGDYLLAALTLLAKQYERRCEHELKTAPFAGSLLGGLDMKATMRSYITGEECMYVKQPGTAKRYSPGEDRNFDPTVFIFNLPKSVKAQWRIYGGSMQENFPEHVRNPSKVKHTVQEKGEYVVGGAGVLGNRASAVPARYSEADIEAELLHGLVVFMMFHFNGVQEARWMENTNYERAPLCASPGFQTISRMYATRHGISLDKSDWPSTLIRMAIPYAKNNVTVIAPDQFKVTAAIIQEAQGRNIAVNVLPLSYFPKDILKRVTRQYLIKPIDKEGRAFPECAARTLNEKVDTFRNLVPNYYLEYGLDDTDRRK